MLAPAPARVCLWLLAVVFCGGCGKYLPLPSAGPPRMAPPPAAPPVLARAPQNVTTEAAVKNEEPPAQKEEPAVGEPAAVAKGDVPQERASQQAAAGEAPPKDEPAAGEAPSVAVAAAPTAAEKFETLFADSFDDQKGAIKKHVEGKTVQAIDGNTRTVYMFRGMPEDGSLVLQAFEDPKTTGPDGKPGVLALSWQEVPGKLPFSGFVYLGRAPAAGRLTLPPLLLAKAASELNAYHLSFRYRAVNDKAKEDDKFKEPLNLPISWRLEPMLPDSFKKRLDLGKFTATDEWGTIDICLKEGTNTEAFLRTLADEHPTAFKIVWAQSGSITPFHPGDTLLIDDIAIKRMPPK